MKFFQAMIGLFLRRWYSKGYVIVINITIIAIIISTTSQMTLKFRKIKWRRNLQRVFH